MSEFVKKCKIPNIGAIKRVNIDEPVSSGKEILALYNPFGEAVNKYVTRQYAKEHPEETNEHWLRGVTCFVVNRSGEVLVEKRAATTELDSGQIDLISGHANIKEKQEETAERESEEETGLTALTSPRRVGGMQLQLAGGRKFLADFYLLFLEQESQLRKQEAEVEHLSWKPMESVFNLIRNNRTRFPYSEKWEPIFSKVRELYAKRQVHTERD